MEKSTVLWLLGFYAVISLLAFVLYGTDKRRAVRHAWRIPEKVLLLAGFCGGSVGALLGMRVFRHKTRHWYFRCVNILGLLWQLALVLWLTSRIG